MAVDQHRAAIDLLDDLRAEHLVRSSHGPRSACLHEQEPIASLRRQVEVVGHHHHREPSLRGQPAQQGQHLQLMVQVQKRRRLIQQQHPGFLDQGARDHGPLPFAARHLVQAPTRQMRDLQLGHHAIGQLQFLPRLPVDRAKSPGRRVVRKAPHQDQLGDRVGKELQRILRHQRHGARDHRLRQAIQRLPEQVDGTGCRRQHVH